MDALVPFETYSEPKPIPESLLPSSSHLSGYALSRRTVRAPSSRKIAKSNPKKPVKLTASYRELVSLLRAGGTECTTAFRGDGRDHVGAAMRVTAAPNSQ